MADFVFVIDATPSMAAEISAVKDGLAGFVAGLNSASIDARFSVVLFGGAPELVLDWTTSQSATETAFGKISVNGGVSGFQNNHAVNPEAGLEALRIVLGEAPNNTLARDHVGGSGSLDFRDGARKNLILVTDEDSDQPFFAANRQAGETSLEPVNPLNAAWQAEVNATAKAVIDNNAFVNMIVNKGDAPARKQYGNPDNDVSDPNFLNFDSAATLAALNANGFGTSLEGQVLSAGLVGRAFDIQEIDTANFVNNFFAAKIEEIVTNPNPEPTPDGGSSALLLSIAFGSLLSLRRFGR